MNISTIPTISILAAYFFTVLILNSRRERGCSIRRSGNS
ncbi:hypothetical protein GACE_2048 [Geoglobus acetivorans]|uniref:Uncharacterized protein n=1 Tax=Geoglobus acetivorans TaxID=565033 RepID=A0A0A7GJD4_GEOAI|nr:hypothetical protein GACE_2048 [Geoglobus acetivorans]